MSKTIDEKVVSMQFDNKHFEKNVSTTMSTLDKLKQKLDFSDAGKGLDNIDKAANKVNFNQLGQAITNVGVKFSGLWTIADQTLRNITNAVERTAVNVAKSLTITPITTGFSEYELKMGSIQTIMASTGESLDTVNQYLMELNKYSDQTIYSFSDMTNNIGKFTNAGVKLEDAVAAIKGISNEAALSGANANEASRAMYNFAQALSAGYVKLIDWKSIENANMATVGFKEELIKTAVEMGTLTKTADGYLTAEDKLITATSNFNDSLQDQWMTSDVLITTLKKYADENTEIGEKASKAATEVKTFSQMMDTLKESAQSGWAETWEIVFGDFNEGKSLWTKISEAVGGVLDKWNDTRNALLDGALSSNWKKLTRKINEAGIATEDFEESIKEIIGESKFDEFVKQYGSIEEAAQKGKISTDQLKKALEGVSTTIKKLDTDKLGRTLWWGHTGEDVKQMQQILEAVGLDIGEEGVDGIIGKHTSAAIRKFQTMAGLSATGVVNDATIKALREAAGEVNNLTGEVKELDGECEDLIDDITKPSGKQLIWEAMTHILGELNKLLDPIANAWNTVFGEVDDTDLSNAIQELHDFAMEFEISEQAAKNFESVVTGIMAGLDISAWLMSTGLKSFMIILNGVLTAFGTDLGAVMAVITEYIIAIRDWVKEHTPFIGMAKKIADILAAVISGFLELVNCFFKLDIVKDKLSSIKESLMEVFGNLNFDPAKDFVTNVTNWISTTTENIKAWLFQNEDKYTSLGEFIIQGIGIGLKNGGTMAFEAIKNIAIGLWTTFCDILGIASPAKVFIAAGAFIMLGLTKGLLDGWPAVGELIAKFAKGLTDIFSDVFANGLPALYNMIKNLFSNIDIDLGTIAAFGLIVTMLVLIKKFLDILSNFSSPMAKLGGVFSALKENIEGFGKSLKIKVVAELIMAIAKAIAIMAASLFLLAQIDWKKSWPAIIALGVIAGALAGLAFAASKLDAVELSKLSGFMISFAFSMLFLAGALRIIGGMDPVQIGVSAAALGGLIVIMAGVLGVFGKYVSNEKAAAEISKAGTMFMKMGVAVLIMAAAIKLIANIPGTDIFKAGGVIAAMFVVFGIFAKLSAEAKFAGDSGAMLLKMAFAVGLLVVVIRMISDLSGDQILKGLVVIGLIELLFERLLSVSIKSGVRADRAGNMLMKMSGAILMLAVAMKLIATLSPGDAFKGVLVIAAIATVFGMFISFTQLPGIDKAAGKAGLLAMGMGVGITFMALAIKMLSSLKMEDILKGIITVGAMMMLFKGIIKVSALGGEHADKAGAMILKMSFAILVLSGAIALLSLLDAADILKATAAITVMLVCFGGIVAATSLAKNCTKTLLWITIAIGVMAAAIAALAFIPSESLGRATGALVALMGMFAVLMVCTKFVTTINLASMFIMIMVVALLAGIMRSISDLPADSTLANAVALSTLLLTMSVVMVLCSVVGAAAIPALTGLGLIAAAIGALMYVMKLIGEHMSDKHVNEMERGIEIVKKVTRGLGEIFGAIIDGFLDSATASLPEIGERLQNFILAFDWITDGAIETAQKACNLVATLASAGKDIDGQTKFGKWLTGDDSISAFVRDFSKLGPNLKVFMTAFEGVKPEDANVAETACDIITAMAKVSKVIDGQSWLGEKLFGDNSLGTFVDQFDDVATNIKTMITSLSDIKPEQIEVVKNAVDIISTLVKAGEDINGQSDVGKGFFGDNSILAFTNQFGTVASNLKSMLGEEGLGSFTKKDSEKVKYAADAIAAMVKAGADINGQSQDGKNFFGDNSIKAFTNDFGTIGTSLSTFVTNLGKFDKKSVETTKAACDVIVALSEASKLVPHEGGWAAAIFGENGLGAFSEDFGDIGTRLNAFVTNLGTFGEEQVITVQSAVSAINAFSTLANSDLSGLTYYIPLLGDNIIEFAKDLKTFCADVDSINLANLQYMTEAIVSTIESLDIDILQNGTKLTAAGKDIVQYLADGIANNLGLISNAIDLLCTQIETSIENEESKFTASGKFVATGVIEGMTDKTDDVKDAAKDMAESATDEDAGIKSARSKFYNSATYLVEGYILGLSGAEQVDKVYSAGYKLGKSAADGIDDGQDSNSPSKRGIQSGNWLGEGLVIGIDQMGKSVYNSGYRLGEFAADSMTNSIRKISKAITDDIDTQPTIRPVLDLSDVESGVNSMNGLFDMSPNMGVMANVRSINTMMSRHGQNGDSEVVSAIKALGQQLGNSSGNTYQINGVTYDDGSNISAAVKEIIRAARVERRV